MRNSLKHYSNERILSVCLNLEKAFGSAWQLSNSDLHTLLGIETDLGGVTTEQEPVPAEVLERMSLLLGIDRAACRLLPDRARATAYLRRPNTDLDGESIMTIMLRGSIDDLYTIRRYLEARLV